MAILDLSILPSKVHLDQPYDFTTIFLVSNRDVFIITQYLEGYTNLENLLLIGILPESISIILVKLQRFLDIFWNLDTKLVILLGNSVIDRCNNAIPFLESVQNPP